MTPYLQHWLDVVKGRDAGRRPRVLVVMVIALVLDRMARAFYVAHHRPRKHADSRCGSARIGTTLRMQFRSEPTRNDDVARELRRRILAAMNLAGVQLVGAHRVTFLNSEPNPMQSPQTSGNTQGG